MRRSRAAAGLAAGLVAALQLAEVNVGGDSRTVKRLRCNVSMYSKLLYPADGGHSRKPLPPQVHCGAGVGASGGLPSCYPNDIG